MECFKAVLEDKKDNTRSAYIVYAYDEQDARDTLIKTIPYMKIVRIAKYARPSFAHFSQHMEEVMM